MALIRLNPDEVISYGGEIKGMAQTVSTLLTEIEALVQQINGGWEGLGNQSFVSQYTELKTSLQNLPEIVEGIGSKTVAGGETMAELERQLGQRA